MAKRKKDKRTKHFTENLKIKQQESHSKSDVNWNAPRGYAVPALVTPVMLYMVKQSSNNSYSVISWNGNEWRDFDDENVFDFHLTCQIKIKYHCKGTIFSPNCIHLIQPLSLLIQTYYKFEKHTTSQYKKKA